MEPDIKENALNIWDKFNYGDVNQIIHGQLMRMQDCFCTIGFYLRKAHEEQLYKDGGYRNFEEYVQSEYHLSGSSASWLIKINREFSVDGNSPKLDDRYRDYSRSQLQELTMFTAEQREQVTPDMTVKEIREKRRQLKGEAVTEDEEIVLSSQAVGESVEMVFAASDILPAEDEEEILCDICADVSGPEPENKEKLKKPDSRDRGYLEAAARHLIRSLKGWMLEDFPNRVTDVTASPEQLKNHLGPNSQTWYFAVDQGVAHINLFDDFVQVWDENSTCIGDFEWFYLAAAIQSMWNVVSLEDREKIPEAVEPVCRHNNGQACEVLSDCEVSQPCIGGPCLEEKLATSQESENDNVIDVDINNVVDTGVAETQQEGPERCESAAVATYDKNILEKMIADQVETLDVMRDYWVKNQPGTYTKHIMALQAYKLLRESAEECTDNETEPVQEPIQPELPIMRNNDQRKKWLRNYKDWGLWYEDEHIGVRYYKYDFDNGARLIAEVYDTPETKWCPAHEDCYLHLVGGPEPPKHPMYGCGKWNRNEKYSKHPDSDTELIEFLKAIQKK